MHQVVASDRPCFERRIVQDEALDKCRLLLFEDPALEAQHRRVVPKGYLALGGIWEVCQSQPLTGKHVGKVVRGARAAQILPLQRALCADLDLGPIPFFLLYGPPKPMTEVLGCLSRFPTSAPPL